MSDFTDGDKVRVRIDAEGTLICRSNEGFWEVKIPSVSKTWNLEYVPESALTRQLKVGDMVKPATLDSRVFPEGTLVSHESGSLYVKRTANSWREVESGACFDHSTMVAPRTVLYLPESK